MKVKLLRKPIAVLLALIMICSLLPISAMADSTPGSINVYVAVSINGELGKAKDGSIMAYKPVTVTDVDADGKFTINDAIVCAHQQYYSSYSAESPGYSISGTAATELWGTASSNIFFGFYTTSTSAVTDVTTKVNDGNYVIASINDATKDQNFAYFTSNKAQAYLATFTSNLTVIKNTPLNIGLAEIPSFPPEKAFLSGYAVYSSKDGGDFTAIDGAISGSDGKVALSFSDAGIYTLTAKKTDSASVYTCAPACVVKVVDTAPTLSGIQLATDGDMKSALALSPDFSPSRTDYTVGMPENQKSINVKITPQAGMENLNWRLMSTSDGTNWSGMGYQSNSQGVITLGTVPKVRINIENTSWSDLVLNSYYINVKKLPVLSGLTIDGLMIGSFDPQGKICAAYIHKDATSVNITPTAFNANAAITVNGNSAVSGQPYALDLSGVSFTDDKADVNIKVHCDGDTYTDNTYTLTLKKEPTAAQPSILVQPAGANYIVGDTPVALTTYASASGTVHYQWYGSITDSTTDGNGKPIDGSTSGSYTPPTTSARTTYYYCIITNDGASTGNTNVTSTACVKVDPDPTPQISWDMQIPKLPDGHGNIFGSNTDGFYYTRGASDVTPLKIACKTNAAGGTYKFSWTFQGTTGSSGASTTDPSITPAVDQVYGGRSYICQAQYKLNGKTYKSNSISVYVFVDMPAADYPDAAKTAWTGGGTESSPWQLTNQADIVKLTGYVASGYSFTGCYFKMINDITLDSTWKSIGTSSPNPGNGVNIKPFSGTFDGGGFTLTYAEGSDQPLFCYVREATVKNMAIFAPYIANYGLVANYVVDYGSDGDYNIGFGGSYAAGCPDTVNITNVTIKSGSVIKNSGFIGGSASGGNIVNIANCTVENNVKIGWDKTAGASAANMFVGSFAGSISGTVMNCVSHADVYGTNSVGGIVSDKSQSMGPFTVANCAFLGSITATGDYSGGIVAKGYTADSAPNTPCVIIKNCYVNAKLKGSNDVGGIFGGEAGCLQNWSSANIQDNCFYGTITATSDKAYAGGIVAHMASLNMYNIISGNYYLSGCGAESGIGHADYVDTSCAGCKTVDGTTYINTSVSLPGGDDITKSNCNRADDPLGKDVDQLAQSVTAAQLTDGTVVGKLNASDTSFKDWVSGTDSYPAFSSAPIAYAIDISGSYKTTYVLGDSFSSDGMVITAHFSDGSTSVIPASAVKFSGFDGNTRGVQTVQIRYGAAAASITVRVILDDTKPKTITVSFTLLGDTVHGSSGTTHTLKAGNLQTWIPQESFTVSQNATVRMVFETALNKAGYTWVNKTGNYVSSITKDGVALAEFTNGPKSGWMYTLNGTHPTLGLDQQYLNNGDVIVWHYTDDYTVEEGSSQWNTSSGNSGSSSGTTLTPTATVQNGTANVSMALSDMKDAIVSAKTAGSIVIVPAITGTANSVKVALANDALSAVAGQTNADLTVKTPIGSVTLPNAALNSLTSQASGSTVTVSLGTVDNAMLTADQKKAAGSDTVYDISVLNGSTKISTFGGGNITISLPYTLKSGEDASGVAVWYLSDSGKLQQMTATYDKTTGLATFTTPHLSYYVVGYTAAWTNPFRDVKSTDWFYDAVKYVSQKNLMGGTTAVTFDPDDNMTRAMLVTVLYRMEGKPIVTGTTAFTDVESGQWYTDAITWANTNKIISGYGGGLFGTDDSITREQLATILYNYAKGKGCDMTKTVNLKSYTDASAVDSWATDAMKWVAGTGMITGTTSTTLDPTKTATRAQVATILIRFSENVVK